MRAAGSSSLTVRTLILPVLDLPQSPATDDNQEGGDKVYAYTLPSDQHKELNPHLTVKQDHSHLLQPLRGRGGPPGGAGGRAGGGPIAVPWFENKGKPNSSICMCFSGTHSATERRAGRSAGAGGAWGTARGR